MSFTEGSNNGTTNDTTLVTVVASPGASTKRLVKDITVYNNDTVEATVTLRYYNGTNRKILCKVALQTGEQLYYDEPIVIPDTSSTVEIILAGAVTTTQLDWTSHYGDSA